MRKNGAVSLDRLLIYLNLNCYSGAIMSGFPTESLTYRFRLVGVSTCVKSNLLDIFLRIFTADMMISKEKHPKLLDGFKERD